MHVASPKAGHCSNLAAPAKRGRMGSMEGAASTTAKERAQHHLTVARSRCNSHAPKVHAVCNAASPSAPAAYGSLRAAAGAPAATTMT